MSHPDGYCGFCAETPCQCPEDNDTKVVILSADQIVVDRQALLTFVRYLDCNMGSAPDLAKAMDALREPFFVDEISTGEARKDFSLNQYA